MKNILKLKIEAHFQLNDLPQFEQLFFDTSLYFIIFFNLNLKIEIITTSI